MAFIRCASKSSHSSASTCACSRPSAANSPCASSLISSFTDQLGFTSRKACCRIIYQNWNRIELRSVRRYAPYSIACQNHRCTTSQKRCPKQRIPAKCDQRQRQQAKCQHKRSDRKSRTPPLPPELLIKHFRHTAPLPSRRQNGLSLHKKHDETAKDRSQMTAVFRVGIDLSSRSVSRQVLSALVSLTSVFGMGTGGPSPLKTPTMVNDSRQILL